MRDLYYDLGVSRNAGAKALRDAFDWVLANRTEGSESYRRAAEAYAVLSDPQRRNEHDEEVSRRDRGVLFDLVGAGIADPPDVTVYLDAPRTSHRAIAGNVGDEHAGWRGLISRRH